MKFMGVYYWYVKIPQCRYIEHGLKDIAFYVQNHIALRAICFNFQLVHDKPLGVPAFVRLVYWHLPGEVIVHKARGRSNGDRGETNHGNQHKSWESGMMSPNLRLKDSWCHNFQYISQNMYTVVLCFALLWLYHQFLRMHILQGYFTGTGAIIWLPQCQWSNPEGYG